MRLETNVIQLFRGILWFSHLCIHYTLLYGLYASSIHPMYTCQICSQFPLSVKNGSMCVYRTKIDNRLITGGTCEWERPAWLIAIRERKLVFHFDSSSIGGETNNLPWWCRNYYLSSIIEYLQAILLFTMTTISFYMCTIVYTDSFSWFTEITISSLRKPVLPKAGLAHSYHLRVNLW